MWNAARHHMPFCTREGRWTGVAAPREAALQTPGCRVQSRPPYLWRVAAAILQTVANPTDQGHRPTHQEHRAELDQGLRGSKH